MGNVKQYSGWKPMRDATIVPILRKLHPLIRTSIFTLGIGFTREVRLPRCFWFAMHRKTVSRDEIDRRSDFILASWVTPSIKCRIALYPIIFFHSTVDKHKLQERTVQIATLYFASPAGKKEGEIVLGDDKVYIGKCICIVII